MNKAISSSSAALVLALAASGNALAQATTVQLGVVNINPNSSTSAITGPLTPVDTLSIKVQSQTTLFFSIARDVNPNWEVQLALGVPPTHDVNLVVLKPSALPPSVAAQEGTTVAKVRQIAPTLFANYKFGESSSQFRPFVGVGVNYTVFDPADSTAAGDAINGGATSIKLSNSFGLAAQIGATAKLGGPWSVTGSWSTAMVKTTMKSNTLGIERSAEVQFHPSVFTLAVGYTF